MELHFITHPLTLYINNAYVPRQHLRLVFLQKYDHNDCNCIIEGRLVLKHSECNSQFAVLLPIIEYTYQKSVG